MAQRGDEGSRDVHVVVRNMAGEELFEKKFADLREVKERVAKALDLYTFGFDLICPDGSKFENAPCVYDGCLELMLVKLSLQKASSSRFLRVQTTSAEDAKPKFMGREDSRWVSIDLLKPRLLVILVLVLFFAFVDTNLTMGIRSLIAYVIYLVEALVCNPAARALQHLGTTDSVAQYIDQVKQSRPVSKIKAVSYHYETRARTTGKNGRTETYQERVDSQTFEETLRVQHWADESGVLVEGLAHFPILHIHFKIECQPGDDRTLREHDEQRQALRQRAAARDDHHDFSEVLLLSDGNDAGHPLQHSDMICSTRSSNRSWLSWKVYLTFSILGCSWPYRIWLARNAMKGDFTFRKCIWSRSPF